MERSVGEAIYQATTTKEIFELVRRHAAILCGKSPAAISLATAMTPMNLTVHGVVSVSASVSGTESPLPFSVR